MAVGSSESVEPEHGRDRRKRLTRQSLRRATLDLGLERGLPSVTVEAITERAGVSTRTFFNYFQTKEEAALLPLFRTDDEELARLVEGSPSAAWRDLASFFVADLERATEDGEDFVRLFELHQQNPVLAGRQLATFARFEAQLSAAMEQRLAGGPDAPLRAPLMVGCCITAVRVALHRWAQGGGQGPVRPHLERTLALVEPAFATP